MKVQAFSLEKSISEGQVQVNELFKLIKEMAPESEAYEMEQEIFSNVMKIGFIAMQCYFAAKGTGDMGPELCSENEEVFKREGSLRGKSYFSIFGKFKIARTCYRGESGLGIFPLDAQANLPKNCYSYLLQDWMDSLSIEYSFEEASSFLEKFTTTKIYSNRFEAVSRESGMSYDQYYGQKDVPASSEEGAINVASFDGKGVPMIKKEAVKLKSRLGKGEKRQKKKEALVGVNYTIDPKRRTAEDVAKNLIYPENRPDEKKSESTKVRARHIRRMASIERPKEEVMRETIEYAQLRDPDNQKPWVIVMDGALNLWSLVSTILSGVSYTGILDIVHVTEYLWKVANAVHGEGSSEARSWVYDNLLLILQGRVEWCIGGLKGMLNLKEKQWKASQKKAIEDTLRYFENHREWMKYHHYLEAGYPIGSGVVESTCGHTVKRRMEGTGRRWSIKGAEAMLILRSIYTSRDWDDYWQFHMDLERSFHYHDTLNCLGIADDYDELGCPISQSARYQQTAVAG